MMVRINYFWLTNTLCSAGGIQRNKNKNRRGVGHAWQQQREREPGGRRGVGLVQRREVVHVQRRRPRRVGRPRAEGVGAAHRRALGQQAHAAQRHCTRTRRLRALPTSIE